MSAATLDRVTFTTSRLLEFFSEKELTTQTGHGKTQWPLVTIKELVANALDAAEEAGTAPVIAVTVDSDGVTVTDNGPGIPPETVAGVLDYSVRVSSREAYCAPDRGSQGNALKTLVAMPFVLDGSEGHVTITGCGVRHGITVRVDQLRQEPVITTTREHVNGRTGTVACVHWPGSARSVLDAAEPQFLQIAEDYAWLNPHLTISAGWDGEDPQADAATDPGWVKWKPSMATSAHWYTPQSLERLAAAYVTHPGHEGMLVREFVTMFRGLSSSAKTKTVLAETGMARTTLADLVAGGHADRAAVASLLNTMKQHSRPVKPAQLGVIGQEHLAARVAGLGAKMESFTYKKLTGETGGLPWVVEAAFAWCPGRGRRRLVTGVNWSPGIVNPFRQVGWDSLDSLLERQRADEDCAVVLHLARPVAALFTNRGKSEVVLPPGGNLTEAIGAAVTAVTARWAKQRKAEERHASAQLRRYDAMTRTRRLTLRDATFQVMEEAYLKASGGDRFYANARQIMYAARPLVLAATGGEIWSDDSYFTQQLLPDYISEHGLEGTWKVAYDARGHLVEPHRGRLSGAQTTVALGTREVRAYQTAAPGDPLVLHHLPADFPTSGPRHRYPGAVFIEKEGFDQQIAQSGLADKHDVAFMSTKGMSNTAARELVDHLAAAGVVILVVHDFDRAGFSIAGTLTTSSRRYEFRNDVDVTDLGLRLADVEEYGLESEPWREKVSRDKATRTLRRHGATEEEICFLIGGGEGRYTWGQRVELNAFASDQFIDWLDAKLTEYAPAKMVPDAETLELQYRRALARHAVNKKIDEISEQIRGDAAQAAIPGDLAGRVEGLLASSPAMSWDAAVAEIAQAGDGDGT
jgi:DNA topoisomerase VI subunit B